jgi:hypothetical protein
VRKKNERYKQNKLNHTAKSKLASMNYSTAKCVKIKYMKIGIDISQMAYTNTGVANFTKKLVENLLSVDKENEYILFFSSLRKTITQFKQQLLTQFPQAKVKIIEAKLPPTALDVLWNRLHILPIETFIGKVDIFIASDWTQPPVREAKNTTILYDLIIYKYPEEMDKKIVQTHKRRLSWVKKECDIVFCISESTKQDAKDILGISENKLKVIYPGA